MLKVCRTCAAHYLIHACEELEHGWPGGRLYWEQGIDEATDCPRWRVLPEPLLVDVLAEALRTLVVLVDSPDSQDALINTGREWDIAVHAAVMALARHKKEASDAQKN